MHLRASVSNGMYWFAVIGCFLCFSVPKGVGLALNGLFKVPVEYG
jgi:hypothetical protein